MKLVLFLALLFALVVEGLEDIDEENFESFKQGIGRVEKIPGTSEDSRRVRSTEDEFCILHSGNCLVRKQAGVILATLTK